MGQQFVVFLCLLRKESLLPLTPPFKLLLPLMSCFLLQPGSSLEQTHIFVLAHILRRPIIVYGVKYYKSFRGETLGYTRFQGELAQILS